jgi:hypothetical protein
LCKRKRIQRLILANTGKIPQTHGP